MKFGFKWDKYNQELTLNKPLALLFGFETLFLIGSIIVNLIEQFWG